MLHPRLPYLFKDTIVLSLTLTEFLQASDDSFRLKPLGWADKAQPPEAIKQYSDVR